MSPDDPRQLLAFLKAKAVHVGSYVQAGSYSDGWTAAAVDVEIWIESATFRRTVAEDNEKGLL